MVVRIFLTIGTMLLLCQLIDGLFDPGLADDPCIAIATYQVWISCPVTGD